LVPNQVLYQAELRSATRCPISHNATRVQS